MMKSLLTSLIVAGTAIIISAPKPTLAASQHRPQAHVQRHAVEPRGPHAKRDLRHKPKQQYRPSYHHRGRHHNVDRHRSYKSYHKSYHRPRHHAGHSGVHVGVHIGVHRRSYHPHGHHLHVHDVSCPVVIHHHYIYAAPSWTIQYWPHPARFSQTIIHLIVEPHHGEVYINGNFLGLAHTFQEGNVQVPVSPGTHTVQLRYGGKDYTRQIHVRPGATTLVKAERL